MPKKSKMFAFRIMSEEVIEHIELEAEAQHSDASAVLRQALHLWHDTNLERFKELNAKKEKVAA